MRHITPYIEIEEECSDIQSFLDAELPDGPADPSLLIEYGNQIAVYVSRTGALKADATYWYHQRRKDEIFDVLRANLTEVKASATTQNEMVKSLCAEELSLLEWCDRLNSACSKRLSWCQSELGLIKNDLIASRGING